MVGDFDPGIWASVPMTFRPRPSAAHPRISVGGAEAGDFCLSLLPLSQTYLPHAVWTIPTLALASGTGVANGEAPIGRSVVPVAGNLSSRRRK